MGCKGSLEVSAPLRPDETTAPCGELPSKDYDSFLPESSSSRILTVGSIATGEARTCK